VGHGREGALLLERGEEGSVALDLDELEFGRGFDCGLEQAARNSLGVGQAEPVEPHELRVAPDVGNQQESLPRHGCDAIPHGEKGNHQCARAVAAAAAARDADGRAARSGDDQPLPAAVLGIAGARAGAGCGRCRADPDSRLVEAAVRPDSLCATDDGLLPRCRRRRNRRSAGTRAAAHRSRGRLRRVRPGAVSLQPLRSSGNRVARALRSGGACGIDREDRLPGIASPRLPPRTGGLRPCGRIAGDLGDRRVPDRDRPVLPPAGRERARAFDRCLPLVARDLAHTLPRRRPALLRPGGERPDEEERCRRTSCSRP
jgi:hypothetical protein